MYDVAIIGAGVVGSAIARELSKYQVMPVSLNVKKTCATVLPKQTVPLSMVVLTQHQVRSRQN